MSISTIISIVISFGLIIVAFIEEGGIPSKLLSVTSAMIVIGGTVGVIGVAFPAKELKRIPGILKIIFFNQKDKSIELIEYFKGVAIRTRKDGLLILEEDLNNTELDPFVKKGIQMVVDGVAPETIKSVLEIDAYMISERHKVGAEIFSAAGGFAPTLGIIGTVMGLVNVLGNLGDPDTLGEKIATAFIATLYGVGTANLLYLPMANKLKLLNKVEMVEKELIIEAIISIQEGMNPNLLYEKLLGFVNVKDIKKEPAQEA